MSTKTLRKRIALATVAAVGAGVLSLVSTSVANAANNSLVDAAAPTSAAGSLFIASKNSVTGVAENSKDVAVAGDQDLSVGLVNISDIAGNAAPYAGTTQTAVLLSNGKLVVYTKTDGTNAVSINVSGGTLTGFNTAAINSTATSLVSVTADTHSVAATITPNAGATSMTVTAYTLSGAGSINTPTSGTLFGQITVTVAASSTAGTVSLANSGIYYASANNDGGRTSNATTGTWSKNAPDAQYANIRIKDAYGSAISSTTGLLTASATNGAYVHLDDSTGAKGTQSTAFLTGVAADDNMLTVSAPSFAPLTTVVTISYNGTVIGTKSFTFTGPITKVTLGSPALILLNSHAANTTKAVSIAFADAAGNTIYKDDTYYPANGFVTDAASDVTAALAVAPVSGTTGYVDWTAGSVAATSNLVVDYVNTNGAVAKSNVVSVANAGTAYTYTAAFDKSSYGPGEIATLTVTFKDSKGNLAADDSSALAGVNADAIAIAGGTISATPAPANTALGVVTYKVLVGNTEGTYNSVVNIKNPTNAFSGSQAAQIATFSVKSGSTSLNDVLKGIVALIASINKQIAALAKLVTKKK